jgi:hypothetical protein
VLPYTSADALDAFSGKRIPHIRDSVQQHIAVRIYSIAELVVFEPMPQPFDGIQFRTVRR